MKKLMFIIGWAIWIITIIALINFVPHNNQEIKSINEFEYVETTDRQELIHLIQEMETHKANAFTMAQSARNMGYPEEHEIILLAKTEWEMANNNLKMYQTQLENLGPDYEAKYNEYPVATEIWMFLKNCGYNDYVAAGILGNMMAEVGGNTLDIRHWLTSSSGNYYGICQWSKGYSEVHGTDLYYQCEFLKKTIQYEFDTYGSKYQPGFDYESFINLTDEREAALAFAKCYERCNSNYYVIREDNATTAYNYFTN